MILKNPAINTWFISVRFTPILNTETLCTVLPGGGVGAGVGGRRVVVVGTENNINCVNLFEYFIDKSCSQ